MEASSQTYRQTGDQAAGNGPPHTAEVGPVRIGGLPATTGQTAFAGTEAAATLTGAESLVERSLGSESQIVRR